MFAYLEGKVIFNDQNKFIILIDSGLGFEIFSCAKPSLKETVKWFLTHIHKELGEELYGFETYKEKKCFDLLLRVKGVGPKLAFSLLNKLGHEGVVQAILLQDKNILRNVSGVGQKTSELILLELKNKIREYFDDSLSDVEVKLSHQPQSLSSVILLREAIAAFESLGKKSDVITPLAQKLINENHYNSADGLVKDILKQLR